MNNEQSEINEISVFINYLNTIYKFKKMNISRFSYF